MCLTAQSRGLGNLTRTWCFHTIHSPHSNSAGFLNSILYSPFPQPRIQPVTVQCIEPTVCSNLWPIPCFFLSFMTLTFMKNTGQLLSRVPFHSSWAAVSPLLDLDDAFWPDKCISDAMSFLGLPARPTSPIKHALYREMSPLITWLKSSLLSAVQDFLCPCNTISKSFVRVDSVNILSPPAFPRIVSTSTEDSYRYQLVLWQLHHGDSLTLFILLHLSPGFPT